MKRKFLIFITMVSLCCITIRTHAQDEQNIYHQIDDYLHSELEKAKIPGLSIIIVNQDEILFSNIYGNCDNIATPFIIGSMTKSFTALSIMQLVEQHKIELDDAVSKYLTDSDVFENITIRQLLNQTSGLSTYQTSEHLMITKPQNTHLYANVNYELLGKIIENVSGLSYEDYIKQNIYIPLGMTNSYTSLDDAKQNGLIDGYRNYFGFQIPQEIKFPDGQGWLSVPAGYLISNASDLGKYLQMYLNHGQGIISAESIDTLFYDNVYDQLSSTYYGMGWVLDTQKSEPLISHSGLVENYMSNMFILPESNIGVVMLVNTNDFLVTNNMMSIIGNSIISLLMGVETTPLGNMEYFIYHALINLIYMIILSISLLPFLTLKRWLQQKNKINLSFILLHIIFPTTLLLIPSFLGIPFFVIRSFVPDLYLILFVSICLAYGTGLVKLSVKRIHLQENKQN